MSLNHMNSKDREAFVKSVKQAFLEKLTEPQPSCSNDDKIKVKDALKTMLHKKQSAIAMEKKNFEKMMSVKEYCDNQINLITRKYFRNEYQEVILSCKNLLSYLTTNQPPERDPIIFFANFYTAKSYLRINNLNSATKFYKKAQEIPKSKQYKLDLEIFRGELLVHESKYSEAGGIWEKAVREVEDAEKKAWLYHELGQCYFELKEFEKSREFVGKCVSLNMEPWECYGWILFAHISAQQQNFQRSLDELMQAEKLVKCSSNMTETLEYILSTIATLKKIK